MFHKWAFFSTFMVILTSPVWSDDPPVTPGIKQQRVSPKVLREALNLPEYKARIPESSPAPSLEPLQRLSEKLKTSGDHENHELLQQFIQEHQRLKRHSALDINAGSLVNIRCKLVEVDLSGIPQDSILRRGTFGPDGVLETPSADAFGKELDHDLVAHKATNLFEPVLLTAPFHEKCHFHQGKEIPRPSSDGSPSKAMWEIGTILDVAVSPITVDVNRIDMSIELSQHRESVEATSHETVTRRNLHATFEAKTGQTSIVATSWGDQAPNGHRVFLVTRVTPGK